jgi:hypothetical protein
MALFPHFGRTHIAPPELTPAQGGIFQAAEVRPMGAHEVMGVTYQSVGVHQPNLVDPDAATCIGTAAKTTEGFDWIEDDGAFVLYSGVACNAFGSTDEEYSQQAEARLVGGSQRAVEEFLWTKVFPGNADATDDDIHVAVEDITPTPGTPVSPKLGLGLLLEHAGEIYDYVPTVHFGKRLGVLLAGADLVKFDEDEASVQGGAEASNGAGYTSKIGPGGREAKANEVWMYATGKVLILEGAPETNTAIDPETNKRIAIAERAYLTTVDGFVAAILVTLE